MVLNAHRPSRTANGSKRWCGCASLDELGPVDYVVVEVPAGKRNFTGQMAAELLAVVDSGTIRVIDVLILTKNEDGTVDATELSDIDERGPLQAVEAQLSELLAEEDVAHLANAWSLEALPECSSARTSGHRRSHRRRGVRGSTDRQRADPDPGDHRLYRGRRSTRDRRSLTCHSDEHESEESV
jgi:hypothetical protein